MEQRGMVARSVARLTVSVPLVLFWAVGALIFFRLPLFSGFNDVTGDNGDARLIVYLHEHWMLVFRGLSPWRELSAFFPATDTLGYTDTFIADEIVYAPLRLAGLDIFLAYQWTLIALSLLGFLGACFLLRRILPDHRAVCATLALVFTFSNMMYVQAGHSQLYSVYWLPLIILLMLRASSERPPALVSIFLAGLLLGILFLSTFYVAWFFVLSSILWCIAVRYLTPTDQSQRRPRIRRMLLAHRRRMTAGVVGAAIGGLPFLVVYLPQLGPGARSLGGALRYASEPLDILNTGARNYFWGPFTRGIFGRSTRIVNGELGFGLTPVLLIALIAASLYFIRRSRKGPAERRTVVTALATAATCWAAILLPMKVFGVVSMWVVVWLLVPGANAIRAVDRFGVIAGLLAPMVVAFAIADLLRHGAGRPGICRRVLVGTAAALVLVLVEQFNVGQNARIDRPAELAALAAVPLPPPACHAFYLTISKVKPPLAYVSSIDAMLISQSVTSRSGRPVATINGFSGQFPADYASVADPGSSTYDADVRSWIASHGIAAGMCGYDPAARRWTG